jgi:hypothetical protein
MGKERREERITHLFSFSAMVEAAEASQTRNRVFRAIRIIQGQDYL